MPSLPKLSRKTSFQHLWVGKFSSLTFLCSSLTQSLRSCHLEKKSWGQGGISFPDLLTPGLWHILGAWGQKKWKIYASLCNEISTTALLHCWRLVVLPSIFILPLFCVSLVYICIKYWLLLCFVHDSYMQYK